MREPETAARNLQLMREVRSDRGEEADWLDVNINDLDKAAGQA